MNDLHRLTIHEASKLLKQKKVTAVELTRACLKRLAQADEKLHA